MCTNLKHKQCIGEPFPGCNTANTKKEKMAYSKQLSPNTTLARSARASG